MLSSQVPLAMASKAMRHSTLSTTTEVYGHLLRHVAHQAVDAIDTALGLAERSLVEGQRPHCDHGNRWVATSYGCLRQVDDAVRPQGDHTDRNRK